MKLTERREIIFAPGNNTFGLRIFLEIWESSDGKKKFYWKYGLPDTVQVLGITQEGEVIGISEFQPGIGAEYFHLIGETMEEGEKPEGAARRGLLEETGYEAGSLELLSSILQDSGRSDKLVHFFLATGCYKVREGEKEIKVKLVGPAEFWRSLMDYFMNDPSTKHGGSNTLKLAALVFSKLGLLNIERKEVLNEHE